jgi:hypothetical protein
MENTEMETHVSEILPTVDGSVAETVESTEAVQIVDVSETVTNIYNDVHIIMVFIILTFAMSCMRAWRRNSLKGV